MVTSTQSDTMGVGVLSVETPIGAGRRETLLAAFQNRYNRRIPLANQPSDLTLASIMKLHARRSCDFVSLAKVSNAADVRNTGLEPAKLRDAPFMVDSRYFTANSLRTRKRITPFRPEISYTRSEP